MADIQFQVAPLALSFYQFNNKDFMVAGGVEGTIYVIKVKIVDDKWFYFLDYFVKNA